MCPNQSTSQRLKSSNQLSQSNIKFDQNSRQNSVKRERKLRSTSYFRGQSQQSAAAKSSQKISAPPQKNSASRDEIMQVKIGQQSPKQKVNEEFQNLPLSLQTCELRPA